ncbi:aldose 1-epimerase [Polaribacter sp. BAL334]|uniref:aldose 1-epimerase n=1 Tax=Polaribacter sp. BAL334 TaxID=1708178 RepID=UPI0018D21191|nr:aldose 1-epimerase [Polaribacter sp. BAL334]MBG7613500.1 aldose 1-epimerase [Polaribacter sp. BAL334]
MFTIHQQQSENNVILTLENASKSSKVVISLHEGARVSSLILASKTIIKEIPNFDYKDSYAASILFPFVSRIENGIYEFEYKKYQLDCNQAGINALHGLVYNKVFVIKNQEVTSDFASVTLGYIENNPPVGFPFKYALELTYKCTNTNLEIHIQVTNIDEHLFPFTIGWHPYFYTENLAEAVVKFNSNQQIAFDEKLITKEIIPYENDEIFVIKDKQLDDCFVMDDNKIKFETAEYQLEITSDSAHNFLQMYTPPNRNLIAIEPMTGISNSFNNKIGLQVLAPEKTYEITWNLSII